MSLVSRSPRRKFMQKFVQITRWWVRHYQCGLIDVVPHSQAGKDLSTLESGAIGVPRSIESIYEKPLGLYYRQNIPC